MNQESSQPHDGANPPALPYASILSEFDKPAGSTTTWLAAAAVAIGVAIKFL